MMKNKKPNLSTQRHRGSEVKQRQRKENEQQFS
jgi:hypothetical protein